MRTSARAYICLAPNVHLTISKEREKLATGIYHQNLDAKPLSSTVCIRKSFIVLEFCHPILFESCPVSTYHEYLPRARQYYSMLVSSTVALSWVINPVTDRQICVRAFSRDLPAFSTLETPTRAITCYQHPAEYKGKTSPVFKSRNLFVLYGVFFARNFQSNSQPSRDPDLDIFTTRHRMISNSLRNAELIRILRQDGTAICHNLGYAVQIVLTTVSSKFRAVRACSQAGRPILLTHVHRSGMPSTKTRPFSGVIETDREAIVAQTPCRCVVLNVDKSMSNVLG